MTAFRLAGAAVTLVFLSVAAGAQEAPETPRPAPGEMVTEIRLAVDQPRIDPKLDLALIKQRLEARLPIFGKAQGEVEIKSASDIRVRLDFPQPSKEQLHRLAAIGTLELRQLQDIQTASRPKGRYSLELFSVQDQRSVTPFVFRFRDRRNGQMIPKQAMPAWLRRQKLIFSQDDIVAGSAKRRIEGVMIGVTFSLKEKAARTLAKATGGKYHPDIKAPGKTTQPDKPPQRRRRRKPLTAAELQRQYRRQLKKQSREVRFMAWILDGELVGLPVVQRPITSGQLQLTTGFRSDEDARLLEVVLNGGPLPAPLKVLEVRRLKPAEKPDSGSRGPGGSDGGA